MVFRENDKRDMVLPDQFKHHARLFDRTAFRHGDYDQIVGVDSLAVLVVRGLDAEGKPRAGFSYEQKRVASPDEQRFPPEGDDRPAYPGG